MPRSILIILILAGLFTALRPAAAASAQVRLTVGEATAWLNGEMVPLQVPPAEEKGVVFVPLRLVTEAFGAQVVWEPSTQRITVGLGKRLVEMQPGSNLARVDGREMPLNPAPHLNSAGVVMVPLRFLGEALGLAVDYEPAGRVITVSVSNRAPVAVINLDRREITLGQSLDLEDRSFDPDGDPIMERQWENRPPWPGPGTYTVTLRVRDERGSWSEPAQETVRVLRANRPPVARFRVDNAGVAQGETVSYYDESYDPDGDAIVEYRWKGKERAFFRPGLYPVELAVRDARGAWSEPYQVTVRVSDQVLLNEWEYNLAHPLPGSVFPLRTPAGPVSDMQPASVDSGPALLFSDSPETVSGPALLYRDRRAGAVRLYFYHAVAGSTPLRFYVLARNPGQQPVEVRVTRRGSAGPSADAFGVGRAALRRFLDARPEESFRILPGQFALLNWETTRVVTAGQILHGIYDLESNGELEYSFLALTEGTGFQDPAQWPPPAARDGYIRGTFPAAQRTMQLAPGNGAARLLLADGQRDTWVKGYDALTGQPVENLGNYGVLYSLALPAGVPRWLLWTAGGGGFAGTAALNGETHGLPIAGFVSDPGQAVLGGRVEGGAEYLFMPPAGSNLPVTLWLLPVQ